MASTLGSHLLVSIPHSGWLCPREIPLTSLSTHQQRLAEDNIDQYTDQLYDFRDYLGNKQVVFPYSQVFVNVNRHPSTLDQCVPLSLDGIPVYCEGMEPSVQQRINLVRKYHNDFHRKIRGQRKLFILDGHSTTSSKTDVEGHPVMDDIIVSDWQQSELDSVGGTRTAPEGYLETYAEELERRLLALSIHVTVNTTYVTNTYGHIMGSHGWDGRQHKDTRAPLLLQETNEALYLKDGKPDVIMLEELRRNFAEALSVMLEKLGST